MNMKTAGNILIAVLVLVVAAALSVDHFYVSGLKSTFMELEKERIETSNKLATAKIVHENLNHVRDLVFENMDFTLRKDSVLHETHIFNFVTTCVNDLKLNLLSVRPLRPRTLERVTTFSYDIELEGDFFKFGELCSKFENSRRIIALESYDVRLVDEKERAGGGPEHKMIRVSMRINTYRVKKS